DSLFVLVAVSLSFVIGSPEPKCPSDGVSTYRDATNCTKYYECNRGHLITLECTDGMYFNEKIRACDDPEFVDCDPVCPYPSDDVIQLYDPKNCTTYYECNRGIRVKAICPPEVPYWNHIEKYCDFPEYVDCSRGETTSSTITTTPSPTPASTATSSISSTPSPVTSPSSAPTASTTLDPSCPYPSTEKTYLVYPYDCSRYYLCVNGEKTVEDCPEGFLFDDINLKCDFSDNVTCDHASTLHPYPTTTSENPDITTTSTASTASTASTHPGTTGPTPSPDPSCSSYPAGEKVSLVYPLDCSKYYLCYNGKKSVEPCPEGLYFDDVSSLCTFRDNVSCEHASTLQPYPTKTSENPDITTPPTAPTHPGTTGPTPSPDPSCSSYPAGEKVSLVYPYDCSKYYLCYNGKKSVEPCPEGLYFDDVTSQCTFRENASCAHASTPLPYPTTDPTGATTSTAMPSTTSEVPTKITTPITSTTSKDGICKDEPTGTTLSDPDDCACYFECSNGLTYHFTCAAGTLWDKVLKVCADAESVIC
ncbi:unnamed protein product, partial [Phaedon cochleariae]